MKFNINWKELGKQLWQAVWPVILGALGGGIAAVTGCSSMQPSDKTQSISGANFTQDFLKRLPAIRGGYFPLALPAGFLLYLLSCALIVFCSCATCFRSSGLIRNCHERGN